MPSMSRGKVAKPSKAATVVKPQKRRKKTESSRRHHFEGFSQRIAKLKIDPLRRTRRVEDLSNEDEHTYIGANLEEWKDLNLSETFTRFAKEISPLVESLPMVLHNEDLIMDTFVRYLEKKDIHSLEPLLGLLAHFAHDLDIRFEKHFQRAVGTVALIASKIEAPEAIEWSFTCLAWLFKYLSRLLVPDLRPLFDLMKPFLGKEKQKPFVIRFAAEAVSFLVRKAGSAYGKNKEPLEKITRHIIEDFVGGEREDLYAQGLMTLFTESIKGIQGTLHSGANAVLQCLLDLCFERSREGQDESALHILQGSVISTIHHTDEETFQPVFESLLEAMIASQDSPDKHQLSITNRLLFTVVAVRKGSRISDWSAVTQQAVRLVKEIERLGLQADTELSNAVLHTLALVFASAPFDVVISKVSILDVLLKPTWKAYFLPFSYILADLDQERFNDLCLTALQKFITSNWKDQETDICAVLPNMYQSGLISTDTLIISNDWLPRLSEPLKDLKAPGKVDVETVALSNARLQLIDFLKVEGSAKTKAEIANAIQAGCRKVHQAKLPSSHPLQLFTHGNALSFYASNNECTDAELLDAISAAADYKGIVSYWKALHAFFKSRNQLSTIADEELNTTLQKLIDVMIDCLSSSSHELREAVLPVLRDCYKVTRSAESELLEVMQSIEDTTISVQTSRFISSQMRKLAHGYGQAHKDPILARAIPTYCFGLLHLGLAQAWDDAAAVLKEIAEFQPAEDVITSIATEWLRGAHVESEDIQGGRPDYSRHGRKVLSDFECSNMNQIEAKCRDALEQCSDSEEKLQSRFLAEHKQQTISDPFNRTQALKVLSAVPQLAEKRSRLLVPVLLQWAGDKVEVEEEDTSDTPSQRWNRKDQKAMLALFALFQNPRVLYKSDEVQVALLSLLMNGDLEIQKSALQAILAWKIPEVNRYKEHLLNFLDDARFREEISIFLYIGEEEGIRPEDVDKLMPVLLRLLYGRAVTRAGVASGARGQQSKRKAIFGALSRFPERSMSQFIDIALAPVASNDLIVDGSLRSDAVAELTTNPRKQFGILNMIDDMLETLGTELRPFAKSLADAALLCLLKAKEATDGASEPVEGEESHTSLYRSVRQAGFHCLIQLFDSCPSLDWTDHAKVIMDELIAPRLDLLPIETAQSISGILRIFSAWSASPEMSAFLVAYDEHTVQRLADCLIVASAKTEVKLFIVQNVLARLLEHVSPSRSKSSMDIDENSAQAVVRSKVLEPNSRHLLVRMAEVLRQNPSKELLDACVTCVARLAPLISGIEEIKDFVDIATFLLKQPAKRVAPSTKRDLLQTLCHLVPSCDLRSDPQRFSEIYQTTSPLFAYFKDRESRVLLSELFAILSKEDQDLELVSQLSEDLNSFASNKIDEPDFERRNKAFNLINDELYETLSEKQWRPILHNMLYYVRDNDELAIRTSASFSMRRFVQAAALESGFKSSAFEDLFANVLFPGLQNGMKDPSELVRTEYLAVLAHIIKHAPYWSKTSDMQPLLAGDDEEASFFINILHIQQHRRLRALRRLQSEARSGHLSSGNASNIFIPLLEHFVFDNAQDEAAHNLTAESIHAVGALSQALEWTQYRNLLKKYIALVKNMTDREKTVLRLISATIDGLHDAAVVEKKEGDGVVDEEMQEADSHQGDLKRTLPSQVKLSKDITDGFLPPLTVFLHHKDESTVSLRVPVAVSVIKLLRILPEAETVSKLPGALMDVCHILRSRDQGARDMTRKTLTEITALLGPTYFNFILKELRSALQRGYQLHVLSFTVHSIMVENIAQLKPGDLDFCLPEIVSIVMDDIFGTAGQEKEAEEYISKMKEVKSSKSFDSMELVAKITTLPYLSELIRPIQTLLMEKLDLKTVKKIDELMRRIGLGVTQNSAVIDRDVLVFCYEIIKQINAVNVEAASASNKRIDDYKTFRYIVQMKSANKSGNKGATSSYVFKLVRFAFDLLRSVLQRHEDLKTPANVAGFLPMAGEALVGGQEEVQMSAVRLLTSLMKIRAPKIESDAPVYAAEAVNIIRAAPSMTTEGAQAALKLVSAILRERPAVKIRETDIAYTLKRLKPDLEQPDRQGVIFNFLKAVLGRKIVITEVYETLDVVAAIMVTNQTRTARDLARGTYFQFFMDYPQSKDRLSKQMTFLVKNLEFQYVEGRQSVLELLHQLLNKTHGDVVQELSSMLFVPLIMMMANDDASACREMAGALISKILERADDERRENYITLLRSWLEQDEQSLLRRIALQGWSMYINAGEATSKEVAFLHKQITGILPSIEAPVAAEEWELLYYALQAFAKISEKAPAAALATNAKQSWTRVFRCLLFPHAWVKLSAARLTGLVFGDMAKAAQETGGLSTLPLRTSGNMVVTADELRILTNSSMRILEFAGVTEQLAAQTARNIVFLGRCFGANEMVWKVKDANDEVDDQDEESQDEDDDEDKSTSHGNLTALSYLFYRLARILRRELSSLKAPSLVPKTTALQTIYALTNALDASVLLSSTRTLEQVLAPLVSLTSPDIPAPNTTDTNFTTAYATLQQQAQETMNLLQKKLGTSDYVKIMGNVQKTVREKREERRVKRRIERVADPAAAERMKRKKLLGKKERRKEKSSDFRGRRRGY